MAHTNDFYDLSTASTPGLKDWNSAVFRTNEMKGAGIIQTQALSSALKTEASGMLYAEGKHLTTNVHRRKNSA